MKPAMLLSRSCLALAVVAVVASGCTKPAEAPPEVKVPPSVAAFTSGTVSSEVVVRVELTDAVVAADKVGVPLDSSPFKTEPEIEGSAVWANPQTLELRPLAPLTPGQTYALELPLEGIMPTAAPDAILKFGFTVMRQALEVTPDGLEAASDADATAQRLRGTVTTADVADPTQVEQTVVAKLGGEALPITWTHSGDRRRHTFIVKEVKRTAEDRELVLSYDGKPIGAEGQGEAKVRVPGLSTFAVIDVSAVHGDEQRIEVRFSDPLDKKQDLSGLVRVGSVRPRFVVDGSVLKIYADGQLPTSVDLTIEAAVRSAQGGKLKERFTQAVAVAPLKPAVRFGSAGVFVPTTDGLTIPIETANLSSIIVEAVRVPYQNIPQFLQVNNFDGDNEMHRVGRTVWREVVDLGVGAEKQNRWVRFGLDVRPLIAKHEGGLYRLKISFKRQQVIYDCNPSLPTGPVQLDPIDDDSVGERQDSYWDYSEEVEGVPYWQLYEHREDPCHPGFYYYRGDNKTSVTRNVLVTDLGLVAKVGADNTMFVAVTDLRTAAPIAGVRVQALDYQQQEVAAGSTNGEGTVRLTLDHRPFVVVAKHGGEYGYLKLDDGAALSVSRFDVGGDTVKGGIKGKLYGERGVWRPGDDMYLTFVLHDPDHHIPADHPVRFDLLDPRGSMVDSQTRRDGVNGFYLFHTKTADGAPTGNYLARVRVGGATFEETLKVETVRPNRLKIAIDFQKEMIRAGEKIDATLTSTWLHGAIARFLQADVNVSLEKRRTSFARYSDFEFDDPMRRFEAESASLFEGTLNDQGQATVSGQLDVRGHAPGMLTAVFSTRVFESGGVYSSDTFSLPFSPYERYVGIRPPKGDAARGMLLTDTKHPIQIVALDPSGKPVSGDVDVEVKLYKINWRWWWEKGEDGSLADFMESAAHQPLSASSVVLKNGEGTWSFEIKYPDWGRYLVLAEDKKGGHRTGKIIYVDWPGWAGRGQQEQGGAATMLAFSADKQEYEVGDDVTLTIPTAEKGRALVSLESGTKVVAAAWVEAAGTETRYTFKATPEMAPTIYAHVTFVQPHMQAKNDLPIRMYGIVPIKVVNPATRLAPVLETAEVYAPESTATIKVHEEKGRPMTYTVAVVDEGLLGLTRFETPNLWSQFYRREALGVRTWDVYDLVAGAYGASLERLLAIGGDGEAGPAGGQKANRFPPMVRFMGPFALAAGETATHSVDVPLYTGAVRVMVVAGQEGAFGSTDKSVFVRKPLMVLATLPRVVGPEEQVRLPVTVFALEEKVKKATVKVSATGPLTLSGEATSVVSFDGPGDRTITFAIAAKPEPGVAKVEVVATGAGETAKQTIEIDVRLPGTRVTDVSAAVVEAGKSWTQQVTLPGFAGTNTAVLEVSRIPPIDLTRRLDYLVQYPHGCIEQTTSSVFPQVYLSALLDLPAAKKAEVEKNVKAGVERIRTFQTAAGGFSYWPGDGEPNDWGSNYAGHFLLEAKQAGYVVQQPIIDQWKRYQRNRANTWSHASDAADLDQAYRLYTLALAGAPELGAMNRLKEQGKLSVQALWRLAAAYQLAGKPEVAKELTRSAAIDVKKYRELTYTYGSDLRDRAMILEALWLIGDHARGAPLAKSISESLAAADWLSTQEIAYALIAMARYASASKGDGASHFSYRFASAADQEVNAQASIVQQALSVGAEPTAAFAFTNRGDKPLFVRLLTSGLPRYGTEKAAESGLKLSVRYLLNEESVDVTQLEQGTDFIAEVTVTNTSGKKLDELALSHLVAAGWEIRNARVEGGASTTESGSSFDFQDVRDDRIYTYFDLGPNEAKSFRVTLNASYLGKFYRPLIGVEAMYDASLNARLPGEWVEVTTGGSEVAEQ